MEPFAKVHSKTLSRDFGGSLLQVRQDVARYDATCPAVASRKRKHLEQNAPEERKVAEAAFAKGSMVLEKYPSHQELQKCDWSQLQEIAGRLRQEILQTCARQGGHLASSLGCVELCLALHRHFDLEGQDAVFFDVGHQAYAHKLLTGRQESFARLRDLAGASGFPNPEESSADPVYAGHAGVAVSQALGCAKARELQALPGRAIAVIGDGSLGCGIVWEAFNNLDCWGKRLVVILNDNQMAISPCRGTLRKCLNRIIAGRFYNRLRSHLRRRTHGFFMALLQRIEHGLKGMLFPKGVLFQEFGFRYFGPVDGNNLKELCGFLSRLPDDKPVLLHIVTKKGCGYAPAEQAPEKNHSVSAFNLETGLPLAKASCMSYSEAFERSLCALAEERKEIVAVSAAMLGGTGMKQFAEQFPQRCFDVGIAEEHAVSFASGLAQQGMRPVVALYSTFLQRALDNVYHDICLNNLPVVLCLDRSGVVPDGPTHHGIYALPFLRQMPNLTIMAPADDREMQMMLACACTQEGPSVIQYPRGKCVRLPGTDKVLQKGRAAVLRQSPEDNLVVWATGQELQRAFTLAEMLEKKQADLRVKIVNPRFLLPFDACLAQELAAFPQVVLDDATPAGLAQCLQEALFSRKHRDLLVYAWPANTVIPHGKVEDVRRRYQLEIADICEDILRKLKK